MSSKTKRKANAAGRRQY